MTNFTRSMMICAVIFLYGCASSSSDLEWREYLGGPERNHYSALDQLTRENVSQLQPAWVYHTGDSGQMQCNPIIVDGILYGVTATIQPFALDAATGEERWRVRDAAENTWYGTSRGVVYWEDGDDKRILYTREEWLMALDAQSGKPILSFGDGGKVSLKSGLGPGAGDKFVVSNTPGTVYEDLIIMPLRLSEGHDAAPGHIQAFNIRTGSLEWIFETIPAKDDPGFDTWPADVHEAGRVGGANNWAGMAVDRKRGIVYVPTGSAAFDFHGGFRHGANLFANTLLALDARTGRRIWHYQFVHHDILDRDAPAPPNLVTVQRDGKSIDAVAQVTKQGYVFVFDRETGEPFFPILEDSVPASDVHGEKAWSTQPIPTKPKPFTRQRLSLDDVNPYSKNKDELVAIMRQSHNEGPFTPLSLQGTLVFPGLDGGAEWGGAAVDPKGVLYVNSNEMAWHMKLVYVQPANADLDPGMRVYLSHCSACHGARRTGNTASGYPSLLDAKSKWEKQHITQTIKTGKGMMPGFPTLSQKEIDNLLSFLYNESPSLEVNLKRETPEPYYNITGYTKFLDADGYPGISPPWGTLSAIDLNTGDYVWQITYGEYPELIEKGIPPTGAESYGGPLVSASGLLFIAGTRDKKLRAYDTRNGDLLWETTLPAAAFATPATYEVNGKQYIVIACGGTKLGAAKGDSYVAFALP